MSPTLDPGGDAPLDADVVIVGAGVAGLFAASRIARSRPSATIVVVDKGRRGRSGSSPWAQGGVAVALGPDDSPDLHAEDTIAAGDGLCDAAAVRVLTREGPDRVRELIDLGAEFDYEDGALHLAREGGQTVPRSVHRADATGAEMVRALRAVAAPAVRRVQGTAVMLAQASAGSPVRGVWVLSGDELSLVGARAVLLATGGSGGLFAATTNQSAATGDGVALAWRAGAALRDLEFFQFHPTSLAPQRQGGADPYWRLLLTEALRGAGATLHDAEGRRFMPDVHPDAELAPRHVVAKAILARGGEVRLDATTIGRDRLDEEFPTALQGAAEQGLDLAGERVPVTPAAHYQVGGVRTDIDARTSIPGLWAAGEVASTGVHGANRMAGNSLLEALVFAARAADAIVSARDDPTDGVGDPPTLSPVDPDSDPRGLHARLRETMWDGCGPVRDAASLATAAGDLAEISRVLGPPEADERHVQLMHGVTTAALFVRAAARRMETRGGHVRDDHPARKPAWDDVHLEFVRSQ